VARAASRAAGDDPATLLEALGSSLVAAAGSGGGEMAPPAAVIWPDEGSEWAKIVPLLLRRLPQLLILGNYDPRRRTGPAIWIKCVLGGTLPEPRLPDGSVPIVYLPGVGRQALSAGSECPKVLEPLIELLYRGVVWTQRNGKDWTLEAFLISPEDGLGLDLALRHRGCAWDVNDDGPPCPR